MENETFIKTYDNAIPHVLCDMLIEKFDANTDQWENRDKRTEDRGNLKFNEVHLFKYMDTWKEEVQALHEKEYKDVELSHMLADNCAMQLLRNPKQFDVIVTDNLFGDMLSDQASMLTGSLGLLPSASLGAKNNEGEMRAMYEPIHGSAPDIAGKGIANPIATILSFAMALRYSLDLDKEAESLEKAVQSVLNDGLRTKDILSKGMKEISTSQMGDAIISKLQ